MRGQNTHQSQKNNDDIFHVLLTDNLQTYNKYTSPVGTNNAEPI